MNPVLRFLRGSTPTGLKIVVISAGFALLSLLPLFLYILFGPADGNPIGLGLLAFAGMLGGMVGCLFGVAWLLTGLFRKRT